jgi:G:T-mismatch repair DNA endonuclease (very short patch repair protein)
MKYKYWIQREINFLKRNYGIVLLVREIAKKLRRTNNSIQGKAKELHLKSKLKGKKLWIRQEIDFLKQNYGKIPMKEVMKEIHKKKMAIYKKANKLNLLIQRKWTEQEIAFLIKNYGKKPTQEITKVLDRGKAHNIDQFVYKLRKKRKYPNLISSLCISKIANQKRSKTHKRLCQLLENERAKIKFMKRLWQKKKYRNKQVKAILKAQKIRPNKPEKMMMQIIKENHFPFNYVGDGRIIIGGFNPDFLSKTPHYIIEVFGDYWHNLPNMIEKDKRKLKAYAFLGYKTLVIWEHELKEPQKVAKKVNEFLKK